ncbi:hypothetical protein B0H17DRAFT_301263 [Mycena rosella]|uniref:Uncharacterized protein n=1 Tax=Mycena rosella TaxID=1033263 RepID=A0AAD7CUG4_MYCRO|nr:hypothetical protein B0H17DRAFT_301263 [Mycena rosella]
MIGPQLRFLLTGLLLLGHHEDTPRTRAMRRLDHLRPIETAHLPTRRLRTTLTRTIVAHQVQIVDTDPREIRTQTIGTAPRPGSRPINLLLGQTDEPLRCPRHPLSCLAIECAAIQ